MEKAHEPEPDFEIDPNGPFAVLAKGATDEDIETMEAVRLGKADDAVIARVETLATDPNPAIASLAEMAL
ncbi:hypothetical protein FRB95_009767, partial [Tulasnella sp. JGI-2019a]